MIVALSRSLLRCQGRTLNSFSRRQGRAIPLLSRHCRDISFKPHRRGRALRFNSRHEVARSVPSRAVEGAHSIYCSAAIGVANSIAPPASASHRTVVRSASCAIEALKLHFNCAVVRSSFIAPSSAHASLRLHALNLHCPFYLTHVVRLALNFSAHSI